MRAIVLSGGGAKGAYEVGVWKAIRKLHIKFDIVTGTSIGALNGLLMVQNDYYKAMYMWNNINFNMVYGKNVNEDVNTIEGIKELAEMYGKGIATGGMNVDTFEQTIANSINPKKFYNSKINFGLVTVNFSDLKPLFLKKKDIPLRKLKDYLMASATCFPAFKMKEIDGNLYVDGGYYDNLPINLAISLGATEIIAVDISSKQKASKKQVKYDIPITYIKPNNDIGGPLVFSKEASRRNIKLGYNDTMKVYKKYDGVRTTFYKGELDKLISKTRNEFTSYLQKILNIYKDDHKIIKDIINYNKYQELLKSSELLDQTLLEIIDYLALILEIDETKIYTVRSYINDSKKEFNEISNMDLKSFKKQLKSLNIDTMKDDKILLKYEYELFDKLLHSEHIYMVFGFEKRFLAAIYATIIMN